MGKGEDRTEERGKDGRETWERTPVPPSKCLRMGLEVPEQCAGGARDGVWRGARKLSH